MRFKSMIRRKYLSVLPSPSGIMQLEKRNIFADFGEYSLEKAIKKKDVDKKLMLV